MLVCHNSRGLEVLVGGQNDGDKYCVKDDIVTMVYRHIHGKLIKILTSETIDTGMGYLAREYTSQYFDPNTLSPQTGIISFKDNFLPIGRKPIWLLSERFIKCDSFKNEPSFTKSFTFKDLTVS